jgi:RimJ/RimL family protein N-acetyltransferase
MEAEEEGGMYMSLSFPSFVTPLHRPVLRFWDGKPCAFQSMDESVPVTDEDVEALVTTCNEPLIYHRLFQKKLQGRPYSRADAERFFAWAHQGWKRRTWFVFLIRDPHHKLIGAMDIKSSHIPGAEIGYWASATSSGIMTNALLQLSGLAKEAGYQRLLALIAPENEKSMRVVMRAGFVQTNDVMRNGRQYLQFTKNLSWQEASICRDITVLP